MQKQLIWQQKIVKFVCFKTAFLKDSLEFITAGMQIFFTCNVIFLSLERVKKVVEMFKSSNLKGVPEKKC